MVVVLLNMLIAMINNSYQEIEVRPVNWKCSLSLTLICIPVWGMMRVMMLEAHVLLIMSAEQTTGILPGLLQEAPPASQPQGMAHYTCNGPARAESVSWIFPLLHVPLRRACRGPMANWNDYLFPPTFTSASPMLFIKYLLYAEPVLGTGDTEMTKTQSLPWKRFSLRTVRKIRYTNHTWQCSGASAPREVLAGVGGAGQRQWVTVGRKLAEAIQRLILLDRQRHREYIGRQFIKI